MTCIIIEDERPAQAILKSYLKKLPQVEVLGAFQSCIEAHHFFKTQTADVVFLDINLPDISGIDFIKTVMNPPAIIMTTAYPDYAVDSFELATIVDYLVKPFSFDRFLKAMHKVEQRLQIQPQYNERDTLFLNVDKTLHKIVIDDIVYIESDRNYITVVTKNKKLSYIESLKQWREKLTDAKFVQIHKSYIINTTLVDKLSGNEVFVLGTRLPIGRTFKSGLLQQLKIG